MKPHHSTGISKRRPAVLTATAALTLAGCRTYERAPIDVSVHREEFLTRMPEGEHLRALAEDQNVTNPALFSTFDPSDGIQLAEAELIALVFNADLRVARLRAGVTRAATESAGLWEDPRVGVDLTRIIQSTPEPWKIFSTVELTLPLSGRLKVEKELATAEHTAELVRVAMQEWRVRMDVRRAWSEWSAIRTELVMTRDFVGLADEVLVIVDAMEQAGEITRTEARLFRVERALSVSETLLLESRAEQTKVHLLSLMGLAPDCPVLLFPSALAAQPVMSQVDSVQGPSSAGQANPDVQIARAEYEVSEQQLHLAIRGQYPDLAIGPGYGREDGQDQVLLGLSLPLPLLNGGRRAIAEAIARRDLARAGFELAVERSISRIRAAEMAFGAAAAQQRIIEDSIVPLVDAQQQDTRRLAELGEVNTLVMLETLARQRDARSRLIEASRNAALVAIDLEELRGPESAAATASTNPAHSADGVAP